MPLANDSILVTPGSGATVATHTVSAKEHQVVMVADDLGYILGSRDVYFFAIPEQIHVAAAETVHWDMWNGDAAKLVRVVSILQIPSITTAVTGAVSAWRLTRTTAIGTGGSAQTAWLPDLSQTAMDADVTCRSKPTGGATAGTILRYYALHGEETNAATIMVASLGGLELVPPVLAKSEHGILLRPSQGIRVSQNTSTAGGNTGWLISFTIE